jgi:hypothetical protein
MRLTVWAAVITAAMVAALQPVAGRPAEDTITLFGGRDTSAWLARGDKPLPPECVQDGTLNPHFKGSGGLIYTKQSFADLVLSCDFKVSKGCNSGIFFRVGDPRSEVQTALEIQVFDSAGKEKVGKHDCGALYDVLAPKTNAVKPAGEWNHIDITANKGAVQVVLNGAEIINADLDQYTTPGMSLDGAKNKFKRALKDFPREGRVALQDHGHDCWYKNVRVKVIR